MKKAICIIAAIVLVAAVAFASYKLGEKNVKIMDDPTVSSKTTENVQEPPDSQEGEKIPADDMSVEEISQAIRGKVFQQGGPYMGSGLGEVFCFAPESNTYYWFCSSMDEQSRVRAERGTWTLTDGFITLTTEKLVEWQGGHFVAPSGSAGSRFSLEGYDQTLTEVSIESESNFSMFKFHLYDEDEFEYGFYCVGNDYFYAPGSGGIDTLKEEYEEYFSLLEK